MKGHRKLLPTPDGGGPSESASERATASKRKRPAARAACNSCRIKKKACDGARPKCTACRDNVSPCVYTTIDETETPSMAIKRENMALKTAFQGLEELVNRIRYLPEEQTHMILSKLRSTSDMNLVLQYIGARPFIHRPSEQTGAPGLLPSTGNEPDVEHGMRSPALHSPLQLASELLSKTSPTTTVSTSQACDLPIQRGRAPAGASSTERQGEASPTYESNSFIWSLDSSAYSIVSRMGILPSQSDLAVVAPSTVDSRLDGLNVAFWTDVPLTNQCARGAISLYLETDHPIVGMFDASRFLSDLVACNDRHCSRLLFSSLLALTCQAYSPRNAEACARSVELEAEAMQRWRRERPQDDMNSLAAVIFLALSLWCHGNGAKGREYVQEAQHMAARMRLFGTSYRLHSEDIADRPKEDQQIFACAVWGAFNTLTIHLLFLHIPGSEFPPLLPIPGLSNEPTDDEAAPQPVFDRPAGVATAFTSFCRLWSIVSEIIYTRGSEERMPPALLPFFMSKYEELVLLVNSLPASTGLQEQTTGYSSMFLMFFHHIVLHMFRPYMQAAKQRDDSAALFTPTGPQALFAASTKKLKRLMIEHNGHHESAVWNIAWTWALLNVANAVLRDTADPEWRFYFLLCINGYIKHLPSYAANDSLVKGVLALALRLGALADSEAALLMQELHDKTHAHALAEPRRGGYIVDLNLGLTDRAAADVDFLASKIEEVSVFNEFTRGIL